MPDIAMCAQTHCPLFEKCYRAQATPNEYRQSYGGFTAGEDCDGFWPMIEREGMPKTSL